MTEQPTDCIYVRDNERSLSWQGVDQWDRMTMLACLSSDPRTIDELALAWSGYRPDQPLETLPWRGINATSAPEPDTSDGEWLAIDLASQRYSHSDPDEFPTEPGCYGVDAEGEDRRNHLVWLNVPPWWQQVAAELSFAAEPADSAAQQEAYEAETAAHRPPLDFRSVLYGQPLLAYIATQTLGCQPTRNVSRKGLGRSHKVPSNKSLDEAALDEAALDEAAERERSPDGLTAQERAQWERWAQLTKRIHGRWLMTPRAELAEQRPRHFLHVDRQWKDRELEQRRSQWSRDKRQPPPAPRTSALFRYGPMGTEEVICYFELCRELIYAALQWIDDEPGLGQKELTGRLEQLRDGWLASDSVECRGRTVQEVIDSDRQLIPLVAHDSVFDCDCPVCRLHIDQPDLFGPAFTICDTYREDMEEEFAFSLQNTREDWAKAREHWQSWSDAASERDAAVETNPATEQHPDFEPDTDAGLAPATSTADELLGAEDSDWSEVWHSSYSSASPGDARLSLFGIGVHLAEFVDELKRLEATREEIDELNRAFDALARSLRYWLTREATDPEAAAATCGEETSPERSPNEPPASEPSASGPFAGEPAAGEPAAGAMIRLLERTAIARPELTAKSADLQSQIHQWQRQLTPSTGS